MRRLLLRVLCMAALATGSALVSSSHLEAAPVAPAAFGAAIGRLALSAPAQFMYLGRPYCWYPYGWAGPGWYWCGYGTRVGLGWGGAYGWNGWVAPRSYGAMRIPPGYRFRRFR